MHLNGGNSKAAYALAWRLDVRSAGGLDGLSTDAVGADETDRAEAGIELLQAALGAARRQFRIPGDLDGILVVEDEEHRGFLGPDRPAFVV